MNFFVLNAGRDYVNVTTGQEMIGSAASERPSQLDLDRNYVRFALEIKYSVGTMTMLQENLGVGFVEDAIWS